MNTNSLIKIALGITLLASAGTATAEQMSWRTRGKGAYGVAYAQDECTYRGIDATVSEQATWSGGGRPTDDSTVLAGYWSYDWCKGVESFGWGYAANADIRFDAISASASFSMPVVTYGWQYNEDGYWEYVDLGTEMVTFDLSWVGHGDAYHSRESWSSRWGRTMAHGRSSGTTRDADITLRISGSPLTFSYGYGTIGTYQWGDMVVYH